MQQVRDMIMRLAWFWCGCLFLGIHFLPTMACGEVPPNPQWVWHSETRDTAEAVFLRKEFALSKNVASARLLGVADFARGNVFVNGRSAGKISNFGLPLRTEVGLQLQTGSNVLAISCRGSDGPSAIAMRLELEFRDGERQVILSNSSWLASQQSADGWKNVRFQSKEPWKSAETLGRISPARISNPELDTAINPLDDYTQWKQAISAVEGTDPSTFSVTEGFELERLRSAGETEGSWVSIEFDPKGRLIVGREDRGLLRMTIPPKDGEIQVETVNDTLKECRGLLFAHGCLYASANNTKGLYRLRDTDGDDQFNEVKLLYESSGGVGHGRNDLALGPDGKIYLICGDSVDLPTNLKDRTSPFREHSQGQKSREGHVVRFDPDGSNGELMAAGLRNPYGIAFHPHGELFTYDADAEYDMGSPWYRPTRIVHIMPGSDYGWRGVTKSWPPYYPDHADNAPPVLDIGKGSPTGVKFGTKSRFPKSYRESLFVSDWAYGRILRVQLTPRGASYVGRASTFLKGQPFNVTDLDFGPDGAMYVVTGGRKTQSALYRIRYVGTNETAAPPTAQELARERHAGKARQLRHRLESLHHLQAKNAITQAWPHLKSADPWIRYAARIAIEHLPLDQWKQKALDETDPTASLAALMALARAPNGDSEKKILLKLISLSLSKLTESQQLMALDTYRLCFQNGYTPSLAERTDISRDLAPLFPTTSGPLNLKLTQVLAEIGSSQLVPEVMDWLPHEQEQSVRLHGLFVLRDAKTGWTPARREDYFSALLTTRDFQGGEGMPTFVRRIEADALAALSESLRPKFQTLLKRKSQHEPLPKQNRPKVRDWKLEDLAGDLSQVGQGHKFEQGKTLFREALCIRCHRVGFEGAAVGPDLTSVGRRFSRGDLLASILTPSKVVAEHYRQAKILTTNGETFIGQIIPSRDFRSPKLQIATNPLEPYNITEILKSEIESHQTSQTSVMPEDLLDSFTKEEIFELIAWIEAGGNPKHPNYR